MATAFTPEKPGADGSRIEGPDEVEAAPPGGTDVDPAADDSGWRIRWPKDLAYPYNPPKFFHNQVRKIVQVQIINHLQMLTCSRSNKIAHARIRPQCTTGDRGFNIYIEYQSEKLGALLY